MIVPYDIIFLQEAEITQKTDIEWLTISGYSLHHTAINPKSHICAYVKNKLDYQISMTPGIEAITILVKNRPTITGVYRSFKTSKKELCLHKLLDHLNSLGKKTESYIIGDMNLDYQKIGSKDYQHRKLYDIWLEFIDSNG